MGENLLADVVASYQEERHPPGQYLGLEDEVPATLAEGSDGDQWSVPVPVGLSPHHGVVPANAGDAGLIPGSVRSPGEGNGNPLQYSCLENPRDGASWWAAVSGVACK